MELSHSLFCHIMLAPKYFRYLHIIEEPNSITRCEREPAQPRP